jgi:osmotically-inducible protein OsmY
MSRRLAILAAALALAACAPQAERPTAAPEAPPPVRSRTESNRDDALKAVIHRRLSELDRRALRAVTVEVWQGRALLLGAVPKPEQRRKAEQVARAVEGVTEVVNELVLAEDKALDNFAPDPAREEAVRRALGIEGKAGITVRVVNGVAFLMGAASSPAQAEAMKADALDVDGVKWAVGCFKTP